MSEFEKYEELIRQKFEEKEFIFNEENWEKAEKMLDSAKKSNRVLWWGTVFLIGIITGSCIMFFITKKHTPAKQDHRTTPQTISTEKQNNPDHATLKNPYGKNPEAHSTIVAPDSVASYRNSHAGINNSGTQDEYASSNEENHSYSSTEAPGTENKSGGQKQKTEKSNAVTNHHLKAATDPDASSSNAELTVASASGVKKSKQTTTDKKQYARESAIPENNTSSENGTEQRKITNGISGKNAEKNTLALNTAKKPDKKSIRQTKGGVYKKGTDSPTEKNRGATDPASGTALADSSGTDSAKKENELILSQSLANKDSISADSVKQEEKQLVAADSTSKADSALATVKTPEPPLPMDGLASGTQFSADLGMHAQLGWKYPDAVEGRGITPIAGVGITHQFNQKWSVSSGAQYACIAHLKVSFQKTANTTYSFGSTTIETSVKKGVLSYLVIPLTVQYHVNNDNAFLLGGSGGFLLNRKSKIQKSTSHVNPAASSPVVKNSYENYYGDAFSHLDASLCVGYRRRLLSRYSITVVANYGLSDVKKNEFFSQNFIERNSGIKLILSYNLFGF
jgi:hypothetical protein